MTSFSEEVTLEGHIIDSWTLPRAFDTIMDMGGSFDVQEIQVGRAKDEVSFARLKVHADTEKKLESILLALQSFGAVLASRDDVSYLPAPADGVLPQDFYSTTHLPTQVRLNGRWVEVQNTEMDLAIVVSPAYSEAHMIPSAAVCKGELVVVGHDGIRILPPQRSREREIFSFMGSNVSSEHPKRLVIEEIAKQMRDIRRRGGKVLVVAGPAIVHSGAGPLLAKLIRDGYVQVLFGGNAIATHDVESILFGTSLGVASTTASRSRVDIVTTWPRSTPFAPSVRFARLSRVDSCKKASCTSALRTTWTWSLPARFAMMAPCLT